MASPLSELPEGFALDEVVPDAVTASDNQPKQDIPPPPPGFVLDSPAGRAEGGQGAQVGVSVEQQPTDADTAPTGFLERVSDDDESTQATRDANEMLGLDPNIVERAIILPFGRNAQGQTEFAVPQIALDIARAILLPGQVLRGVPVELEDVVKAALAAAGPATKPLLGMKATTKAVQLTARQIAEAPSSINLTKASGKKFTAAKQAGASLKADDYVGFLAGAERDLIDEGIDALLHPKLTAVFNALTKKIGSELDATDLHNVRRTIGIATRSLEPDEARIARVLRDNFDDFVENLPGTKDWVEARGLYIKARKAETVEDAINEAGRAASGLENGLRIEFRKILKNSRKARGFTNEEKAAMQAVVDGDFTANTLKKLGKFGFGSGKQSNTLGGTTGILLGGVVGGPVGSAAAALGGQAAARGALQRTQRAADILRALVAGVRPEPVIRLTDPALGVRSAAGLAAGTEGGGS